eukprot:2162448-Pleurochrysis_carterae.AAC.1
MEAYHAAVARLYGGARWQKKAFRKQQRCRREAPRSMDPKSAKELRQKCTNHEGRRHPRGVDTIRRRARYTL